MKHAFDKRLDELWLEVRLDWQQTVDVMKRMVWEWLDEYDARLEKCEKTDSN